MYTIKFNAIDIDGKMVYCFFRDTSENKKNPGVEKQFSLDTFVEKEPRLKDMLEGDVYSIYLEDSYTEKKSLDGSYVSLTKDETDYITSLVKRACVDLEFDVLLSSSIDDQINSFIKEFFEEKSVDEVKKVEESPKDFLAEFFKDIEQSESKKI